MKSHKWKKIDERSHLNGGDTKFHVWECELCKMTSGRWDDGRPLEVNNVDCDEKIVKDVMDS